MISLDNIFIKNKNIIAKKLIDLDRGKNVRSKSQYINILNKNFKHIKSRIYNQKFIPYTWYVAKCSS